MKIVLPRAIAERLLSFALAGASGAGPHGFASHREALEASRFLLRATVERRECEP